MCGLGLFNRISLSVCYIWRLAKNTKVKSCFVQISVYQQQCVRATVSVNGHDRWAPRGAAADGTEKKEDEIPRGPSFSFCWLYPVARPYSRRRVNMDYICRGGGREFFVIPSGKVL